MLKLKPQWHFILLAAFALFGFQNCGDFTVKDELALSEHYTALKQKIDRELPSLIDPNRASLVRWFQKERPQFVDKPYPGADKISAVIAIKENATGKVWSSSSGTENSEETSLTIENGKLRLSRIQLADHRIDSEISIAQFTNQKLVIAFSASEKPGDFTLLINGYLQDPNSSKTGNPTDFSYVVKTLTASSAVEEFIFYSEKLNASQLNSLSRSLGQSLAIPVAFDPRVVDGTGGGGVLIEENPDFVRVKALLQRQCISCHNGAGAPDFRDSKSLSSSVYVIAKDPQRSSLYMRLRKPSGNGPSNSLENMPPNGQISSEDVEAVKNWILSL